MPNDERQRRLRVIPRREREAKVRSSQEGQPSRARQSVANLCQCKQDRLDGVDTMRSACDVFSKAVDAVGAGPFSRVSGGSTWSINENVDITPRGRQSS